MNARDGKGCVRTHNDYENNHIRHDEDVVDKRSKGAVDTNGKCKGIGKCKYGDKGMKGEGDDRGGYEDVDISDKALDEEENKASDGNKRARTT